MPKRFKIFTQEGILQILESSDSKLSDLSEDKDIDDFTFESRILEGGYS